MKKRWNRHRPLFPAAPAGAGRPKWHTYILPVLWTGFVRLCTVLGAIVLIGTIMLFYTFRDFGVEAAPPRLPDELVLYLPLEGDPGEMEEQTFGGPFSESAPTIHDFVEAIDRAATDKRIKGIVARMDEGTFSMARASELRTAIKRFRSTGKFAYIYSPSYSRGAGDLGRYYLASAFQEVWMQPMGLVSIAGVRAEVPYARATLDKIGIYPQFYQRKEYKTGFESITNTQMSEASRSEIKTLLADIRTEVLKDVPAERGMDAAKFETLVNQGLFTAPEALQAGLITKADYADLLFERVKKDITGDAQASDDLFVDPLSYLDSSDHERSHKHASSKPTVAVIYVVGAIMETRMGSNTAAADEIAPAILQAAEDERIQAIVLRVDSPGGSPVASESILRMVERAKAKGKPVIVSMGPTAASGGYWVAAYADQIFAMPMTVTGSIGVFGGKVSAGKLWDKVGVNWDRSVQWGDNAGLWSMHTPFSASEAERINAMLDNVYKSFVERVAKGRGMSVEEVEKIAGGRVWSGTRAVKIGLADQIGGLREALDYTAKILGATDREAIHIVTLPAPKSKLERIFELLEGQGAIYENLKFQEKIAAYFEPLMEAAAIFSHGNVAAYEPLRIE